MKAFSVACCQMSFPIVGKGSSIEDRARRMLEVLESAVVGYRDYVPVKLVVFPEFSLTPICSGSSAHLVKDTAIPLENEFIPGFIEAARTHDVIINIGSFLERSIIHEVVYNTSVMVYPDGVLLVYRKLNPFIPLEPVHSPHDIEGFSDEWLPVAETSYGNMAVQICYDSRFPELSRAFALKGAEILIVPSAYMGPWGGIKPMDVWTTTLRARAMENSLYVVGCSLGSTLLDHPPYSWTGGSVVIDYEGRVVAQSPNGPVEDILVAPIYIDNLREFRRETQMFNLAHLRTEIYKSTYKRRVFHGSGDSEITQDSLRKIIDSTRADLFG